MEANELQTLNNLIVRIIIIMKRASGNRDIVQQVMYFNLLASLKARYGDFLQNALLDIYDDLCEDDLIQEIENYLSVEGVAIQSEDFPDEDLKLLLKPNPLRFIARTSFEESTVWKAA